MTKEVKNHKSPSKPAHPDNKEASEHGMPNSEVGEEEAARGKWLSMASPLPVFVEKFSLFGSKANLTSQFRLLRN